MGVTVTKRRSDESLNLKAFEEKADEGLVWEERE